MSVSAVIPELQPGTYHYRVVAKNDGGGSVGADGTFCAKKPKSRRASCQKRARKLYAPRPAKRKKK